MLQMLLTIKPVAQQMGMHRIFDICNSIIRLSGAPYDLNLEVEDGENGKIPPEADPQAQQQAAQLGQQLNNLTILVQMIAQKVGIPLPQGAQGGPPGAAPRPPAPPAGAPQSAAPSPSGPPNQQAGPPAPAALLQNPR
jgi:hypothetical protein